MPRQSDIVCDFSSIKTHYDDDDDDDESNQIITSLQKECNPKSFYNFFDTMIIITSKYIIDISNNNNFKITSEKKGTKNQKSKAYEKYTVFFQSSIHFFKW